MRLISCSPSCRVGRRAQFRGTRLWCSWGHSRRLTLRCSFHVRQFNCLIGTFWPSCLFSGLSWFARFKILSDPSLPAVTKILVGLIAIYSICATHDMFAFYRARVDVANEILAAGVQPNMFDGGFEYNAWIELLQGGGYLNDEKILNPPNSYVPIDPYRGFELPRKMREPMDSTSNFPIFFHDTACLFTPTLVAGRSSIAPVSYFRWLGLRPASLYVVRYQPTKRP